MKAKRAGFFRELPHGDPDGPSLRAQIRSYPQADEERLVAYLRGAAMLVGCPGLVDDILDSRAGTVGSPHIFTDGEWVWPGDLPYYVEVYHVRLPDEFVARVRARGFRPPADDEISLSDVKL